MTASGRANVSQSFNQRAVILQGGAESAMAQAGVLGYADTVVGLDGRELTGSETILLVEDEAFVREVTVEVLKSAGYAVLIAKNAAEARILYDQFSSEVNLLLSDVILPDENGRTLALKFRGRNAELPVLLVTGYAEQVEIREGESATLECLPKPFSARTLLQKVRTVLSRKRRTGWYPLRRACGIE